MPYITREKRAIINNRLADILSLVRDLSAGEVNYLITTLMRAWLTDLTYGRLNEAVGVLECTKMELYRRVAAPYEDRKCAENGEVYK